MLPPHGFEIAPLDELLRVLLSQLKRPLAAHGLNLSDADAHRLAGALMSEQPDAQFQALVSALLGVIKESEAVLTGLGLTFRQSLNTEMADMGGWETTSEFLELANEKVNAELRISLAASLALAFGERSYLNDVLYLASRDDSDEGVIARRVLSFISGVALNTPDWLEQVKARIAS